MLGLHLISCIIIFISCIFQASLLPLKHNTINKNTNYDDFKSYYYPSPRQRANELHDSIGDDNDSIVTKSEMMESSASNYYSPHQQQQQHDEDEYSDYAADVSAMSPENFESAKINPNEGNKKINITNEMMILEVSDIKPNLTLLQQQQVPIDINTNNSNSNSKFSKLLFSSPSATVTSNGPSGPFKAIICHDCENSGVNVGHSVSFSAIKSWNVGSSSNVAQKSSFNESLVKQNHQDFNISGAVEHTSEKYFDAVINSNNNKNSELSINQNVPIENQGSNAYKTETITVNDSIGQQKPTSLSKDWNYSLLTVRNENIKVNNPIMLSTTTTTEIPIPIAQKKPIFNDLLKVPYDVLNQPLTEAPPSSSSTGGGSGTVVVAAIEEGAAAIKQTQIHINHQQKFNDTITNYQHFQQFIQKSPTATNHHHHYQSTPMPEQNYEVDEAVSLMTNGRAHGVQLTTPKVNTHVSDEKNENHHGISLQQPQQQHQTSSSPLHVSHDDQDAKFGVVFEGRDFRKYKVEEKTADGFIVGEYGYLSNTDGSPIFGVRYTADSNINPQLIYDALLKFLKL
ncbi:hypothetical protein PVAND_003341 [Polypedilum vanderplanki]|uniref:Uncharacterized protein n=1 Tax=Polypedilum vanderplanki TaxID=319348 RepID=A0A9J6BTR8_POLVA|nr:hypothetical protein PVAND_003341 [Polypedilum vanderplanki]